MQWGMLPLSAYLLASVTADGSLPAGLDTDHLLRIIFVLLSLAVGASVIYANFRRQPPLHQEYASREQLDALKGETNQRLAGLSSKLTEQGRAFDHRIESTAAASAEADAKLHDRVTSLAVSFEGVRQLVEHHLRTGGHDA